MRIQTVQKDGRRKPSGSRDNLTSGRVVNVLEELYAMFGLGPATRIYLTWQWDQPIYARL